jgi:hypothetical protein
MMRSIFLHHLFSLIYLHDFGRKENIPQNTKDLVLLRALLVTLAVVKHTIEISDGSNGYKQTRRKRDEAEDKLLTLQ